MPEPIVTAVPSRKPAGLDDSSKMTAGAKRARRGVRDAETTRVRRLRAAQKAAKKAARPNRRRINYPRLLLGWATAALVLETAAALLWSPRLWVKTVDVEGCKSIAPERILARLHIGPRENLVRLPVGKLTKATEAEPTVEWAELRRTIFPQVGVHVFVRERTPWASVQVGGASYASYTIDRNLVPFRKGQTPEGKLPRLVLSGETPNVAPVLGKPMTAPGLQDVSRCLAWSASQPTFPLESVEIDPQGKLCLNKVGGLPVRLGSGVDLDKKLKTLGLLLATRPELRSGDGMAEINLFAFDAPAVLWHAAARTSAVIPTVLPSSFSPAPSSASALGGEIVP